MNQKKFRAFAVALLVLSFSSYGAAQTQTNPMATGKTDVREGPSNRVEPSRRTSLSGTWSAEYASAVTMKLPVLGNQVLHTQVNALWLIEEKGKTFTVQETLCKVHMTSSTPLFRVGMRPEAPGFLSGSVYRGTWLKGTDGWSIETLPLQRIYGANLSPKHPLPDSFPEDNWVDVDRDGLPGVTILLRGVVNAEVGAVQRDTIRFWGKPVNADRFEGNTDWTWERRMLSSTNENVRELPPEDHNPALRFRAFSLVRTTQNASCPSRKQDIAPVPKRGVKGLEGAPSTVHE